MIFRAQHVTPLHVDFIALTQKLNAALEHITQDSGAASYNPQQFDPATDTCLVVYCNQVAVACGAFRQADSSTCEIKRMYSARAGAGSYLLNRLESDAIDKGYQYARLSTRRINHHAVQFYLRAGYHECAAYGQYIGVARSICLQKPLGMTKESESMLTCWRNNRA